MPFVHLFLSHPFNEQGQLQAGNTAMLRGNTILPPLYPLPPEEGKLLYYQRIPSPLTREGEGGGTRALG